MKKTGAFLTVYALEQIGVKFTFGIPGVHNTEIYDELNKSEKITPVLVTHEAGAAFMADATSRTSAGIGTCVIVPAAGLTHAMSGIGEAFLDGIPMLIISGGTRRDTGKYYQLHQIDQGKLVEGITKKYFLISSHAEIIPTIYEAFHIATEGTPGPVFIEIPAEIQMFAGETDQLPEFHVQKQKYSFTADEIKRAADVLLAAEHPGIYVGWGAVHASGFTIKIAEMLAAPVSTSFQGLSAFPANHPLHTGVGFGPSAVPAAQMAFKNCDALLAVGTRFSELATGSYGMRIPENLIHIDINPDVFNKNYPALLTLQGDSEIILQALYNEMLQRAKKSDRNPENIAGKILSEKQKYLSEWTGALNSNKVSPGHFFQQLRHSLPDDSLVVVDDGMHTFLTAELFPVYKAKGFISPTDFNCMGYCVPAAIGAKMSNPDLPVIGIVGDGAFLMTGMELITATTHRLGIVFFIFNDGELGQISQFQQIPLNRKTCTELGMVNFEGVATATGASYLAMNSDSDIGAVLEKAFSLSSDHYPVIVDVKIDYSKKTYLTKGVVKTNLSRFPASEKIRFITRAIKRHLGG